MKIELYSDGLQKKDVPKGPYRKAARAIIFHQDKVLIEYVPSLDIYTLPGGGLEAGETLEDCVIRETLEETGYDITVRAQKVSVIEYFIDSTWENNYFTCDLVSTNQKPLQLTKEEAQYGMILSWMDPLEALSLFDSYESTNEYGQNILTREFIGLFQSLNS